MNKKLFAALFATLVLEASVYAQTEANFKVDVTPDGSGVIITGYTGTVAAVRIPATIQNIPVREIGDEAFGESSIITSIIIPVGVTKIGKLAFGTCKKLTSVTIPEGITEIGAYAFYGCTALTAVTLPEGLETIGNNAFLNCTALASAITLPQSLKTLGANAFSKSGITSVTILGDITNFLLDGPQSTAFAECAKLRTVTLGEGVKVIPAAMFAGCPALTTVTFPASITQIDAVAFIQCAALTTVTIPDSVASINFANYGEFQGTKLSVASQAALRKRGYTAGF